MKITRRDFLKEGAAATVAAALGGRALAQKADGRPFMLGVNMLAGGAPEEIEARFERMKALGITEARVDWEWRGVERTKGAYDWAATDRLVSLARKHGVTLFPIVHYAPDWAVSGPKPEGVFELAPREEAFAEYAKFLAASVDRYGSIKNWQVWNEPNGKEFWGPKPDAGAFVKLMRAVDKELGQRRKNITLVHAGLSKADHVFLEKLWEKDKDYGQRFDVMALHPYFFNPRGGVRAVDALDGDDPGAAKAGFVGSVSDAGFLPKVFNVANLMALKGAKKPIWITEIGFMAGDKNPYAVDEAKEKELATHTLRYIDEKLTSRAFGKGARGGMPASVERVYWFSLDDYAFPKDMGSFGLFRRDGSMRPQADAIKDYISR